MTVVTAVTAQPRTAFIHIGPHKTGTTALQQAMDAGRATLAQAGFHYPKGEPNHSRMLAQIFWNEAQARQLDNSGGPDTAAAFRARRQALRDDLEAQIERTAPNHLILSGEELTGFSSPEARALVGFLRERYDAVRVIAYARETQRWLTSAAQQRVKWTGDTLDHMFRAPPLPLYQTSLGSFLSAVGRDEFDLRVYAEGETRIDILSDFATAIGLPQGVLTPPPGARDNSSVSHRTAIVLSTANTIQPPFVNHRTNPCRAFKVVREDLLPGRRFQMPRETLAAQAHAMAEERAWLDDFMGRPIFAPPELPEIGLDDWYGGERAALEGFAETYVEMCRQAQNEKALKNYLRACERRESDPEAARTDLSRAILLATYRWSLAAITKEAAATNHPQHKVAQAKQKLMRRVENPKPGDPPLVTGNPFARI